MQPEKHPAWLSQPSTATRKALPMSMGSLKSAGETKTHSPNCSLDSFDGISKKAVSVAKNMEWEQFELLKCDRLHFFCSTECAVSVKGLDFPFGISTFQLNCWAFCLLEIKWSPLTLAWYIRKRFFFKYNYFWFPFFLNLCFLFSSSNAYFLKTVEVTEIN